jgi:hypothetical protein
MGHTKIFLSCSIKNVQNAFFTINRNLLSERQRERERNKPGVEIIGCKFPRSEAKKDTGKNLPEWDRNRQRTC